MAVKRVSVVIVPLAAAFLSSCANAPLPDPNVVYIALGDSTTNGPAEVNYWQFLRDKLNAGDDSFANEGKGGETSAEGKQRLAVLLDNQIYPNARFLLYWQGGAEIIDLISEIDPFVLFSPADDGYPYSQPLQQQLNATQANIEQVIQTARNAGLRVFVATYYFLQPGIGNCDAAFLHTLLPAQADNANEYVKLLNQRIRQAVENQNATLVDVETLAEQLAADPNNYADCRHLSTQGNETVAELFFDVISSP